MKAKRAHLKGPTTGLLYHLERVGPGGASAEALAKLSGMRTRSCAARLRWLARGKLVRYVKDIEIWQLTDDSIFQEQKR